MLAFALVSICTLATVVSLVSLYRATAKRRARRAQNHLTPPVAVLKPLCGVDDALEANLETYFRQDYPDYELLFGVVGDDPAVDVVARLRERYPNVRARVVTHDGRRALNPKVAQLRALLESGCHDLVVVSDSNIAVDPDYLSKMVAEYQSAPDVGAVTNPIAGVGEQSLGAALENLHLNGYVAGNVAVTQEVAGRTVVVGKSMLFSKSVFESLGGFESVATLLAEDYVMGRMFLEAGYQVRLCPEAIRNVVKRKSLKDFLLRQLRWGLLRSRVMPLAYPLEILSNPMAVATMAAIAAGAAWPLAWGVGLTLLRDGLSWGRVRGRGGLAQALPLGPLKDLLLAGVWAIAPFMRRITWRHTTVRVAAGTRLYAEAPVTPSETLTAER